jgi:murein tripeptide amidase MpaA
MPYMSVGAVDGAIDSVCSSFPAMAKPIALPERSVEGRLVRAIKIASPGNPDTRTGVLFVGGVHARELINPETLVEFAYRLCAAYSGGTGLAFGPSTYGADAVKAVVDNLDIIVLPMANPDGRNYCLVPGGDPMWRKNRSQHPGLACKGADCNRNAGFLWSSGIGTSGDSCSEIFKGPSAFSEPETRNVRWLIDSFPRLDCLIDVHSYSELVLYAWGDDETQSTDPSKNFQNPAYDGQRGTPGNNYKEYMPAADVNAHATMGQRIFNGIAAVRGRKYVVEPSFGLYPTSGTWLDYAYSRQFVETGRRRILGFTIETAQQFQPPDAEKDQVISETQSGLMACLMQTICPAEAVQTLSAETLSLDALRSFRDQRMLASAKGRQLEQVYRRHAGEVVGLVLRDKGLRQTLVAAMQAAAAVVTSAGSTDRPITAAQAGHLQKTAELLNALGSKELKADIAKAMASMGKLEGATLTGLFVPDRRKPAPRKGVAVAKAPRATSKVRKRRP